MLGLLSVRVRNFKLEAGHFIVMCISDVWFETWIKKSFQTSGSTQVCSNGCKKESQHFSYKSVDLQQKYNLTLNSKMFQLNDLSLRFYQIWCNNTGQAWLVLINIFSLHSLKTHHCVVQHTQSILIDCQPHLALLNRGGWHRLWTWKRKKGCVTVV